MSFDYTTLLPLIRRAGEMMRSAHVESESDGVTEKAGSANFVTVYDVKIQNFLLEGIRILLPDAYFIAEEKDNDPAVLDREYCFIIDPIDGTTGFIHDNRHSCVSVGLFSHGEAVFGAVYDPYQDEMFHAVRGGGAYLNGTPIHVSSFPFGSALVSYGTAPYYKDTLADKTFSLCRELFDSCADVRRCGSAALDLAYIAAGRYDAFFEMILSPWDIAAGSLLVTEAGGVISQMDGTPLSFTRPCPVIAASTVCYPSLLEITKNYQ